MIACFLNLDRSTTRYRFKKLVGDSSGKQIFRVFDKDTNNSYVLIQTPSIAAGANSDEIYVPSATWPSQATYLSHFMRNLSERLPNVPQVIENQPEANLLVATDLGDQTLADWLEASGRTGEKAFQFYKTAIDWLIKFQQQGYPEDDLIYRRELNRAVFLLELEELLGTMNTKTTEICQLFAHLADYLNKIPRTHIHRDFQSRNLMIHNEEVYVIDVQDLCQGPCYYDLASLLYDQNAMLDVGMRSELVNYYCNRLNSADNHGRKFSITDFRLVALQRVLKAWARHAAIYARSGRLASLERTERAKQILVSLYEEIINDNGENSSCELALKIIESVFA